MCLVRIKSKLVAFCCGLFVFVFGLPLLGQDVMHTSVPTSPQAEAFKRYGEYSVNYSTGVPDISIPLYEIDHHGYKIPLSLQYYPQPLKPGYNYDVYGHGWGLSVNSSISRSIEYVPDEWRDFKIENDRFSEYYYICPHCAELCEGNLLCLMEQPYVDIHSYNLGHDKFNLKLPDGRSFDFVMDYGLDNLGNLSPVFTVSEGSKLKIASSFTRSNINSFTVVDENGIKYTFDGTDTRTDSKFSLTYVAWQLTRIDLPYSKEPIIFNYSHIIKSDHNNTACYEQGVIINYYREVDPYNPLWGEHVYAENIPIGTSGYYKMKLLSSIEYNGGRVNLNYERGESESSHNYLKMIRVFDNSTLIREISFDMTIKGNSSISSCTNIHKLAKLDSLSILGAGPDPAPYVYRFAYAPSSYNFSGTDHWGYYNEYGNPYDVANFNMYVMFDLDEFPILNQAAISAVQKSQYDLSPYNKIKLSRIDSDIRKPAGPDRHGILSRIIYPTGGYTDFEFENHRFLTSTDDNGDVIFDPDNRKIVNAAGFRIKKITSYASEGTLANLATYRYGKTYGEVYGEGYPSHLEPNEHTGLGVAVVEPNILTYMDFDFHRDKYDMNPFIIKNMVLGLGPNGESSFLNPFYDYFSNNSGTKWQCSFNSVNFRRLVNGRPPVLYPEVTVYYGNIDSGGVYSPERTIGKSTYVYNVTTYGYDLFGGTREDMPIEHLQYFNHVLDYIPKSHLYNKLHKRLDYKFDGQDFVLVQEEINHWSSSVTSSLDYIYTSIYPDEAVQPFAIVSNLVTLKPNALGFSRLISKATTLYTTDGTSITSNESYGYNDRNQLVSRTNRNSKNENIKTTYSYPKVLPNEDQPAIVQQMVEKNMIAPVLETITAIGTPGMADHKIISGHKTEYDEFDVGNSTIIMPAISYQMEFKPGGEVYEFRGEALSYSPNGKPLEVIGLDQIRTSYIWGHNDRYMIAEIKNAYREQVAYTSFEEDGQGGWTYDVGGVVPGESKTGTKCYSGTVSRAGLPLGKYEVSLWAKGSGSISVNGIDKPLSDKWERYIWELDGITSVNIAASGNKKIDEVRLHPWDAMMTSYTHRPLLGMTSSSDVRGELVFYEYDSNNRLSLIKDHNGNILHHYKYNHSVDPSN